MAWSESKVLPANINGGEEIVADDQFVADDFNAAINNGLYAISVAESKIEIEYYSETLLASSWSSDVYVINDIPLVSGNKIIVYPASGSTHSETLTFRDAWNSAEITYDGDETTDEITLTAETAPAIDIDVIVEVRK